ncbi:cation-translocating P-type ATPase [Agromyces intestinalis]|uniref:Cation-translocating P-type ATPase n=1 Tax=Agromyces intestinalis TaxID=2592652 RepID=A0A5C1YFI9_9MICO|nr:cation-translocating P-type ATPase [Agromyces intestinalis]QEO14956.1 cation-translocating P-type ATPase [Agromyces intestinalis]
MSTGASSQVESSGSAAGEASGPLWWTLTPEAAVAEAGSDAATGLTDAEAAKRLAQFGSNTLDAAPPPSWWKIALRQLVEPMTLMLIAVAIVSLLIAQVTTAIVVAVLVLFNIVLGTRQELKARRSVDALANLQTPHARVTRGGVLKELPAPDIVPGDLVELEAGDLVPADGRIIRAANLETQESALTGESLPIAKRVEPNTDPATALADRSSMLFQNTSVTRGTATMVVVETGMRSQVGQIATLLTGVGTSRSPLQRELDGLTKVLGFVAWGAVLLIIIIGFVRGQDLGSLLFLGTAVAISAIPTGLPVFVQGLLSWGATKLAAERAVVASLNDVETLGATSAICSDKTGTLTLNQMTARSVWFAGQWYTVTGEGYSFDGKVLKPGGDEVDAAPLAAVLSLPNDATVSLDGQVVGDPTEAAFIVLAAKLGVDADAARSQYPRVAEVPFDSDYKFMATFQHFPWQGETHFLELVKGAPDIVLSRCTKMLTADRTPAPVDAAAATAAMEQMSKQGLRTLTLAARVLPDGDEAAVKADPMSYVQDLVLIGIVGIVDPPRAEAKGAIEVAQRAGIEVRMITGDHAVTAGAIGAELGLGPGAISGHDLQQLSDDELNRDLADLHVFGRVTPQDKLRLVKLLQGQGSIVAMTGDAVNDAAAIKQANVGVAMGSGSEVTKQAAKLVLTDDNFATLVHAVEIGRMVYEKIVGYLRFQMSQLFSLLMLFVAASAFGINDGVALFPVMVLFLNFFVTLFAVLAIAADPSPPGLMDRPPRDPKLGVANPRAIGEWLLYGFAIFIVSLVPLIWGPDRPDPLEPSASMTMVYVIVGLGTVLSGILMRRSPESGLLPPIASTLKYLVWPVIIIVCSTEIGFLQRIVGAVSLTGWQWLECIALLLVPLAVVEGDKWLKRRRIARRA